MKYRLRITPAVSPFSDSLLEWSSGQSPCYTHSAAWIRRDQHSWRALPSNVYCFLSITDPLLCHHWHCLTEQLTGNNNDISMPMAWDHDSITQNCCRLVQFNCQLLEITLSKLKWVLSSRLKQMGLLFHRPYSWSSSEETAMAKRPGWEMLHNFTILCFFPQGVEELHIQNIFNGNSYQNCLHNCQGCTRNIQAWDLVTQAAAVLFRLLSSPHYSRQLATYATGASFGWM